METSFPEWRDAYLKDCPSRAVLALLSDKWTMLTCCALGPGPMRFGELRRRLEGISQKVLTGTLRDMERAGLVRRDVYPTTPPSVEYTLTELGHTLGGPVAAIKDWAESHLPEVARSQRAYDERAGRTPQPLAVGG
jgi:DNA-binding HxlR family transcriptional regulator